MATSAHGDETTTIAQASLLANPPPISAQQVDLLSTKTEATLHGQFKGIKLTPGDLSFDYIPYPTAGQTGGVSQQPDNAGRPSAYATVNTLELPNQAQLFGLTQGTMTNGRATAGSLLDAVGAEEVAQKIVQTNPQLKGMSTPKEELIGEAAMLAVMPQAYTRTLLRATNELNNPSANSGYADITQQTVTSLQTVLDKQSAHPLKAEDVLKGFDTYVSQHASSLNGTSAPYKTAFDGYFKSLGIQDVPKFEQALQTTMAQDFQATSQKLISDQIQQNQAPQKQTPAQQHKHTEVPDQAPVDLAQNGKFGKLFDQAQAGLNTIGAEKLGVNGQHSVNNVAGVLAEQGLRQNYDNFGAITQAGNGTVFGIKQDPSTHPGPYDHVSVNPKLVADVPVAQSADNAQKLQLDNQTQLVAQKLEPRSVGMG